MFDRLMSGQMKKFSLTVAVAPFFLAVSIFVLSAANAVRSQSDEPQEKAKPENGAKPVPDVTDFKKLKSSVPYTKASIAKGKTMFMRQCTECHGPDGKSLIDVVADATDLTTPKLWYSGTTEGEIFHSIRDGAGVAMPPFKLKITKDEEPWHLVNFVQSLWPKSKQPKLVEEKKEEKAPETEKQMAKVPHTKASIAKGKAMFLRRCAECHGPDGKALMDVIADATDLTQPKYWLHGTSEEDIFRSIRDGAGDSMPPYKDQIPSEEDTWNLVNFIRSLWPASIRPKVHEEQDAGGADVKSKETS